MFYLTTHSTHFFSYLEGNVLFNDAHNTFYLVIWKEGSVLFNDALNTFYLQLFGDGQMIKDHSDRMY